MAAAHQPAAKLPLVRVQYYDILLHFTHAIMTEQQDKAATCGRRGKLPEPRIGENDHEDVTSSNNGNIGNNGANGDSGNGDNGDDGDDGDDGGDGDDGNGDGASGDRDDEGSDNDGGSTAYDKTDKFQTGDKCNVSLSFSLNCPSDHCAVQVRRYPKCLGS
jgi:hypothetical protein